MNRARPLCKDPGKFTGTCSEIRRSAAGVVKWNGYMVDRQTIHVAVIRVI